MDFQALFLNLHVQELIGINFSECIEKSLELKVESFEHSIVKTKSEFSLKGLCLIRYIASKNSSFLILGTTDLSTYNFLKKREPQNLISFEIQLIKSLQNSISEEMSAYSVGNTIKSVHTASEDQMGFLKSLETNYCYRITLKTDGADLIFDIPLTSPSYSPSILMSNIGFNNLAKILIVDDSKVNRLFLKNYLTTVGFLNIDESDDGSDAIVKIKQSVNGYDIIIADWHMPVTSGLELLRSVRTNPKTKSTPFILATSEQKKEEITEALKLKVSGYLLKPYTPEMLFKSMKNASLKIL